MFKKLSTFFLVIILILNTSALTEAAESTGGYAKSSIVIDASSGRVLYEKNAYEKLGMASTTKIMTGICGIEYGNLKSTVTVSNRAAGVEGSSMYLKAGEKISLYDLVSGLMLVSGNDAATAIAESVAGSEGGFVLMMNQKANEIGAYNTCFQNPHGLSHPNHYTTAFDLAIITAYALKNPTFAEIVSKKNITAESVSGEKRSLVNHNKLLRLYDGCVGVKTGFTKATGRCLVSAAKRNGLTLIAVTLNDGNDWDDHKAMLDKGFENYVSKPLVKGGTVLAQAKVKGGSKKKVKLIAPKDVAVAVKKNKKSALSVSVSEKITVEAPVKKGEACYRADVMENGLKVGEIDLVAKEDILEKESAKKPKAKKKGLFKWIFK